VSGKKLEGFLVEQQGSGGAIIQHLLVLVEKDYKDRPMRWCSELLNMLTHQRASKLFPTFFFNFRFLS